MGTFASMGYESATDIIVQAGAGIKCLSSWHARNMRGRGPGTAPIQRMPAATVRHFLGPRVSDSKRLLLISKRTTVGCGFAITGVAFSVGRISDTVIEAIDKIDNYVLHSARRQKNRAVRRPGVWQARSGRYFFRQAFQPYILPFWVKVPLISLPITVPW